MNASGALFEAAAAALLRPYGGGEASDADALALLRSLGCPPSQGGPSEAERHRALLFRAAARFLRLFPKTQTPRLNLPGVPERLRSRPPLGALAAALYVMWLGVWLLAGSALSGALG